VQSSLDLTTLTGGSVTNTTFVWYAAVVEGNIRGNFTRFGVGNLIPGQVLRNYGDVPAKVVYYITPRANGCTGTTVTDTIIVNPIPSVTNTVLRDTVCSNIEHAAVTLTSNVTGATFTWTAVASTGITDLTDASGTGNLPAETFINTGNAAGTVTYSITPLFEDCEGETVEYVVTVNPVPAITNDISKDTVCSGVEHAAITLNSNVTGTTFTWTAVASDAAITGFAASGTGDLPAETFTNTGATAGTVTYSITPSFGGCEGEPVTYIVTINPIPEITNDPETLSEIVCSGATRSAFALTSTVTGTKYTWTTAINGTIADNFLRTLDTPTTTSILPAETFTNTGTTAGKVIYTITPSFEGCTGTAVTYEVTVNPTPTVEFPRSVDPCDGGDIRINFTGTAPFTVDYTVSVAGKAAVAPSTLGLPTEFAASTLISTGEPNEYFVIIPSSSTSILTFTVNSVTDYNGCVKTY
jgi:hypothetical protein